MSKWAVIRQNYWGPEEPFVVEIAAGGIDYANADMLGDIEDKIYYKLGCDQEYTDPREALAVTLAVREEWQKREPELAIRIEYGNTGGMTIPFEEYPDDDDLKKWADAEWEKLPKCDGCGEPRIETWRLTPFPGSGDFCSEYCAQIAYDAQDDEEDDEDLR